MGCRAQPLVELVEGALDQRARVDVAGSAEALGHAREADAVERELAADPGEALHGEAGAGFAGGGGSGSLSGPFWPHAAAAIASAIASAAEARARIIPAL